MGSNSAFAGSHNNVHQLHDCVVEHAWPLIPDALYSAVLLRYECCEMRAFKNAAKVFLHFKIIDPGMHCGEVLYRAYNVRALKRRTGKVGEAVRNGGFILGRRSELLRMLVRVLDIKVRPDRVNLHALKGRVLQIRTRTVIKAADPDGKHCDLAPALQYSVVDEVLTKDTSP